ncbi:hypothetical protein IE53DRAFT_14926 [Violaceomyces palustris]|uniref:Uncharacterized protein n=1 Tax=Violaceomyces palustris TaxID=1673888 RepID=A0ACD0P836_9BASI|nr:hypothetical protein IE53DRAFT_14926 [Violaceomyces palustris]
MSTGNIQQGQWCKRILSALLLSLLSHHLFTLASASSPASPYVSLPNVHTVRSTRRNVSSYDLHSRSSTSTSHFVRVSSLNRRQSQELQDSIVAEALTDPIQAANNVESSIPGVQTQKGSGDIVQGDLIPNDDEGQQYEWNSLVYFQPSASTTGSDQGGWQQLPDTPGFTLNRSVSIPNKYGNESGIMPFYITQQDPSLVKRAILLWPGKPRDAWKYANLMMNARSVVASTFASWGITNDSVLILAPVFLNQADVTAGGCKPEEFAFTLSLWQSGAASINPKMQHSVTSYEIMDYFTDMLFNKEHYPNLNQVVVAGHSMGGQATQRYALLKKTKAYDPNMKYWVGNPGSWAWLNGNRPYMNANDSCAPNSEYDTWPYGIGGNQTKVSKYARADVIANKTAVVDRFNRRNVSYALALLDLGAGDTHCEAQWQGANHLDRGSRFIMQYSNMDGGFPAAHRAAFVANTSHQDYAMYTANSSLAVLFQDNFYDRNPDLTNTTNPGDKVKKVKNGKKSFDTPTHEKMAYGLLMGSILLIVAVFSLLPYVFSPNYEDASKWDDVNGLSGKGGIGSVFPDRYGASNGRSWDATSESMRKLL